MVQGSFPQTIGKPNLRILKIAMSPLHGIPQKNTLPVLRSVGFALLTLNILTYQVASSGVDPTGFGQWVWTKLQRQTWPSHTDCDLLSSFKNEIGPPLSVYKHQQYFL